jgi:hypothetical protein
LRDKDGYLAIHKAIWKGHTQIVELLLPLMKPYIDSPTSKYGATVVVVVFVFVFVVVVIVVIVVVVFLIIYAIF